MDAPLEAEYRCQTERPIHGWGTVQGDEFEQCLLDDGHANGHQFPSTTPPLPPPIPPGIPIEQYKSH